MSLYQWVHPFRPIVDDLSFGVKGYGETLSTQTTGISMNSISIREALSIE